MLVLSRAALCVTQVSAQIEAEFALQQSYLDGGECLRVELISSEERTMNAVQPTDTQKKRIVDALCTSFTRAELAVMLRFKMDVSLEEVAQGDSVYQIVVSLLEWAIRWARLLELVQSASEWQPNSAELAKLKAEFEILSGSEKETSPAYWFGKDSVTSTDVKYANRNAEWKTSQGKNFFGTIRTKFSRLNFDLSSVEPSGRLVQESIRLDVARPTTVSVGESFLIAIAVMQVDSPLLSISDLPSVDTEEGTVFHEPDQQYVRYRVEIIAADFELFEKDYIFTVKLGHDSKPKYFQMKALRDGELQILVNAYQLSDREEIVAQTRVKLEATIDVVSDSRISFVRLDSVKREALAKRLELLLEEYRATQDQYTYTLDKADRVVLRQKAERLEKEIKEINDVERDLGNNELKR